MPVKKPKKLGARTSVPKPIPPMPEEKKDCCPPHFKHKHCTDFCRKIFATLMGILLVYIIILVGTMIRNNIAEYDYVGQQEKAERMMTIEADGKITAKPDIAVTTMGMFVEAETVEEAQALNTKVMNELIAELKKLGVEEKDIQTTNYNIYPRYNYLDEEGRVLDGYEVSQNVTIKIRDLDKANDILALAGKVGANNVSGLDFTIDDKEVYLAEAREKALEKVAEKAQALQKSLGVRFGGVVSYNEYEGGDVFNGMKSMFADTEYGLGGGAPQIESGSLDIEMNVSVTFEIR